ncbi:MAG TPA: hypothetical protein PKE38_16360 [Ignavibacteriaceae bacterium]|nr:hypothetical protein [Ignavibacteriaceae bacterium]
MADFVTFTNSVITALKVAKSFNEFKLDLAVKEKAMELIEIIENLQERSSLLRSQYDELQEVSTNQSKEILKLTEWENNKPNYKFVTLPTGSSAYTTKENTNLTTGFPYYCQNCYDNLRKLSVYQPVQAIFESMKEIEYSCPKCSSKIFVPNSNYKKRPPMQRESVW